MGVSREVFGVEVSGLGMSEPENGPNGRDGQVKLAGGLRGAFGVRPWHL
jgi:hypothetical protein